MFEKGLHKKQGFNEISTGYEPFNEKYGLFKLLHQKPEQIKFSGHMALFYCFIHYKYGLASQQKIPCLMNNVTMLSTMGNRYSSFTH